MVQGCLQAGGTCACSRAGQTGVGQRGAEQKTVFEQRVGDVHGCPEIIVRAAVFLRVSVVGVFPENGENGCQAHGKQSVAVNDAA